MNVYEEATKLMEESFGNNQDEIISLATIGRKPGADGRPRPAVRNVDAYYEDGAFYVMTYGLSNKMKEIAENPEVAVDVCHKWFTANAIGINRGWVMKPENAELRTKLRKVFEPWYDMANNEQDKNCCILEIRLTKGVLIKDHHAVRYVIDFTKRSAKK